MRTDTLLFLTCLCLCKFAFGWAQNQIERGPYLQLATPSSIIIKWRTTELSDSEVRIGQIFGVSSQTFSSPSLKTNHEIKITDLTSDTKYFYSVGTTVQVLQSSEDNYFITLPDSSSNRKLRFWITGDHGNNSANQREVRDQYLNYSNNKITDGWILLGDNAYSNGTDEEYQNNFFLQYQNSIMKNVVIWPAPGNHDYANDPSLQESHNIPYYEIFTPPTLGEAGGYPSNTEAFYSFDVANVHFISLDSYGKEDNVYRLYDTLGPQVAWLKKDLESTSKQWIVVYFHHPPYTKGSHDSDSEEELILIRSNLLRILERYNVDLVLSGHSHSYERTRLMNGHYDLSNTMTDAYNFSQSSGRYDGSENSCPYIKNSITNDKGTVYVVGGSSGQLGGTIMGFPHNAMYYYNRTIGGSIVLEVEKNRFDLKWLSTAGLVEDMFTIMKEVNMTSNLLIPFNDEVNLSASWIGSYNWSNGEFDDSINIKVKEDTLLSVEDSQQCLSDQIIIKADLVTSSTDETIQKIFCSVYPNPASEILVVEPNERLNGELISIELIDALGRKIAYKKSMGDSVIFDKSESKWSSGFHLVVISVDDEVQVVRVML